MKKGLVNKLKSIGKATAVALPLIFSSYNSSAQTSKIDSSYSNGKWIYAQDFEITEDFKKGFEITSYNTNSANKKGSDGFYGDQVLSPDEAPFYKAQGKEHLNFYGSGDADGNDTLDLRDYTAINNGVKNDRTDVNGDGVTNSSDATLFKSYADGIIKYLPGHWKYLQTRKEREDWLEKMVKIDKTNENTWTTSYDCDGFSEEFFINFAGIENIKKAGVNFSLIDTSNNARINIPAYRVTLTTSDGVAHRIVGVMTGNDFTNFNDWYFIEPQNDSKVSPGDISMHKDKPVRIDRMVYYYHKGLDKFRHGYLPLQTWDLNNGKATSKFSNPDAKSERELVPIYFSNIQVPKDTLVNYKSNNQNDLVGDSLKNLYKDDVVTVIEASNQVMNGDSAQVNFDNNIQYRVHRGKGLLDTTFNRVIKVRDLEAPKFSNNKDLVEYFSNLTNIDSNYVKVSDNSNLPLEKRFFVESTRSKDTTTIGAYEFMNYFITQAKDKSGNTATDTLVQEVIKDPIRFSYLPKDTVIKDISNLMIPHIIDDLFKGNQTSITQDVKKINDGFYQVTLTGRGLGKADSITHTYNVDISTSVGDRPTKDNTPAYPNPTENTSNVVFDADYSGNARVELWGMGGKKLDNHSIEIKARENTLPVDLTNYANGMYLFRIFDKNGNLIEDNKLVKQ